MSKKFIVFFFMFHLICAFGSAVNIFPFSALAYRVLFSIASLNLAFYKYLDYNR